MVSPLATPKVERDSGKQRADRTTGSCAFMALASCSGDESLFRQRRQSELLLERQFEVAIVFGWWVVGHPILSMRPGLPPTSD